MTMTDIVKWLVGVDWAKSTHQVCLLDMLGKVLGERVFPHGGSGLAALCDWLLEKTGGRPEEIAVAIEVPHGPIVETLMERGFIVYAINPKQVDRFRDRFSMAGAKDDRFDAHVMADALRTDRHRLRRLHSTDPMVIELREWSRMGEELTQERTRLANRISDQLWRYYPQAIKLTEDVAADWFLTLWALAPSPAKAARIAEKSVARVLKEHRIRRIDAATALGILREKPISVAAGTTEAATAHIRTMAARLKLVNRQIRDVERQLDALCNKLSEEGETEPGQPIEQRDATILRSLPGIGRIVLATLLSEGSEPLQRRDYHALRPLCGVAPVTKRSGKSNVVAMRYACHNRLRNAVYHWARVAIQHDELSRQRYAALRKRGKSHGRAIRTVADRLLGVACAMLKSKTLFDPNRHLARQGGGAAEPSAV
jgi:transposase